MAKRFPSRFMLAAAMKPCPCGFFNDPTRECKCSADIRTPGHVSAPRAARMKELTAVSYYGTVGAMIIVVDLQSSVTLEEQIRSGIRELIAARKLKGGEALPSVRQLAGDLSVHWNTVARAYKRLQEEGLLVVGHGRGVFVKSSRPTAKLEPQARTRLAGKLTEFFVDARLLGLSVRDIRALALEELRRWSNREDNS